MPRFLSARAALGGAALACCLLLNACATPQPTAAWGRSSASLSFAPALQRGLPWTIGVYGTSARAQPADDEERAEPFARDDTGPDPVDPEGLLDVRIGAGFFIDGEGHAVTAAHVVQHMAQVVVRLPDQRVVEAELVGLDEEADIALLRVPQAPAGRPTLGRTPPLRPGDWVLAIGEPYGLNRSVSAGVVGGKDRHFGDDHELLFIQSDLALNPGNSGGPLLDASGAIVGLNLRTMAGVFGTPGVSLSVPIEIVQLVAAELKVAGGVRRPRLGVQFIDLAPPAAHSQGRGYAQGAVIVSVTSGSLGERVGLRTGDVVVGMNGRPVGHSADFARLLLTWREPLGTQFVVRRGAQLRRLDVEAAALE
ncbi:trypsin-like peptidase domain-containing protein [Aquincola sp. MAHUQ-54]|uniref:Trypsin-like peptidase domain-containing protein n=1 Tax=Aquincola agrisoli TaxID=3119538 RepID=A0AAW9QJW0_9BURK